MSKTATTNFDVNKQYSIAEAVPLLKQLSTTKFVGSVDIDIVLELNDKQRKESLRGSVVFPNKFGQEKKILALVEEKDIEAAKAAGAIVNPLDESIKQIEAGTIDFDIVIAVPAIMAKIAKLGRVLGPKGLMPNPANGTVTADVVTAIQNYSGGKETFKMSDQGVIRSRLAKLDMEDEAIVANIVAMLKAVMSEARKFGANPIKKITLSPTMGKGVRVSITSLTESTK